MRCNEYRAVECVLFDIAISGGCGLYFTFSCYPLHSAVVLSPTSMSSQVLGMHFFSPAHLMKLVEVVQGKQTSAWALVAVLQLTKRMGKVATIVGNCYGFVGNRVLDPYSIEAAFLLEEGAMPEVRLEGV